MISNLFFTSTSGLAPDDLKKKFMDACKQNGNKWCLIVRAMDNPVLGVREQEDLSEIVLGAASGAATGDRLPLLVYRVNVADGQESLIRGARLSGLTVRSMRNISGIGNDATPFNFMQSQQAGFSGTALGRVRLSRFRCSRNGDSAVAVIGRRGSSWRARRAGTPAAGPATTDELTASGTGFSLCDFGLSEPRRTHIREEHRLKSVPLNLHMLRNHEPGGSRCAVSVATAIERAPLLPTARTAKKRFCLLT